MVPFERRYKPEYAHELIEIAQGDLESAEVLAASARGRPENVLYLAHQVVEKCLKALLCAGGQPVTHTHDIEALITALPARFGQPPHADLLPGLTEYSLVRRYERGFALLESDDLEAAIRLARATLEWARLHAGTKV